MHQAIQCFLPGKFASLNLVPDIYNSLASCIHQYGRNISQYICTSLPTYQGPFTLVSEKYVRNIVILLESFGAYRKIKHLRHFTNKGAAVLPKIQTQDSIAYLLVGYKPTTILIFIFEGCKTQG